MRRIGRPLPHLALATLGLLGLAPSIARAAGVPLHNHVVVVILENKNYNVVRVLPYTASLISAGASFPKSFAVTHPSQPNYFALWAGGTLGVTNDNCPAPGSPFSAENLGHACEAAGLTWRAYSENLPSAGATGCSYDGDASTGLYTRKHDPWTCFANLSHANERPYGDLAADIAAGQLPNLAYVIPNNCHNSHNSTTVGCTAADADTWLSNNLPPILNALGPAGTLILTWDEDDNTSGNHILTVFAGPMVIPGYASNRFITHFTVVRTICAALGLPAFGSSAAEEPVTDVWVAAVPARPLAWSRLRLLYR